MGPEMHAVLAAAKKGLPDDMNTPVYEKTPVGAEHFPSVRRAMTGGWPFDRKLSVSVYACPFHFGTVLGVIHSLSVY